MHAPSFVVPLVVFLASCTTFVGSLGWQARRTSTEGRLPSTFLVVAMTSSGPRVVNLAEDRPEGRDGIYPMPLYATPITARRELDQAIAALSHPASRRNVRVVRYEASPPRLHLSFDLGDASRESEYEVLPNGDIRPIATRHMAPGMMLVAFFWMLVVTITTWIPLRLAFPPPPPREHDPTTLVVPARFW